MEGMQTLEPARPCTLPYFSCYHGRPFLSRDRSRRWLIDSINSSAIAQEVHVWAWVIMPEHVHLLVFPTRAVYKIGEFLKISKAPGNAPRGFLGPMPRSRSPPSR